MSRLIRSVCLVAAVAAFTPVAAADESVKPRMIIVSHERPDAGGAAIVVANPRLLDLIATWIDAPAVSLFDRRVLGNEDVLTTAALPIARMLDAKFFVYCPGDELPIEAIYRERLANHGVKVIPVVLPSLRLSFKRNQESQKQALIAMLQSY